MRILATGYLMAWTMITATAQTAQQWRDSLSTLHQQIEHLPGSTDLRLRKAAVNIELGQWQYAIDEYGRVLDIDRDNMAALYFRAYCHLHLRHYAQARADYDRFLKLSPLHMEARMGLAMVCQKMGRVNDAADEYNQLVEMFPDSAVCYAARAAFETAQEQYDLALYDWDEAISRNAGSAEYVVTKIELLMRLERYVEALSEIEKALHRGVPRGVLKEWQDKCRKATR